MDSLTPPPKQAKVKQLIKGMEVISDFYRHQTSCFWCSSRSRLWKCSELTAPLSFCWSTNQQKTKSNPLLSHYCTLLLDTETRDSTSCQFISRSRGSAAVSTKKKLVRGENQRLCKHRTLHRYGWEENLLRWLPSPRWPRTWKPIWCMCFSLFHVLRLVSQKFSREFPCFRVQSCIFYLSIKEPGIFLESFYLLYWRFNQDSFMSIQTVRGLRLWVT